jgi:hypothetical protein
MEEREHLKESQRAMKAARLANLSGGVRKDSARDASNEAPMAQVEAAKKLRDERSSGQRAINILQRARPALVGNSPLGDAIGRKVARAHESATEASETMRPAVCVIKI